MAPELWNRMTWIKLGRVIKASMVSFAIVLGLASCTKDYTVGYLYMTTAKAQSAANPHGLINGYDIDYQTGYLVPLLDSPIDTGGRNTVGLVATPNHLFLYTINHDDSDVVEIAIGTDGKLYPQNTYNISGSLATAAAVDAAGKFLYVTFTYQNAANGTQLYTPANPGPGGVSIFPINANNTLGTPTTVNVGRNPVGIVTTALNDVYVIEQDSATTANLLGFTENTSTGALTPMSGVKVNSGNVPSTGFTTGPLPGGILANLTGSVLYITDETLNQVAYYSVASATGVPTLLGSATTDVQPMGMAFDPEGKYLYLVAYNSNTINAYTIGANGLPIRSTVSPAQQTGTGPTCVTTLGSPNNANPSHATYLFTSNSLASDVTGEQLNEATGGLENIQGSPFSGSTLPSCIVAVPIL
jgi:6-phosphogluconolactonase